MTLIRIPLPFLLFFLCCFFSCDPPGKSNKADLIFINAIVHTVNKNQPQASAIALKGDQILAVGSNEEIAKLKGAETNVIDAEGNCLIPGFIEGHGHFSGLGYSLINLNLMATKNWDEIVGLVEDKVKNTKEGEWIIGRGWHQEKWDKPLEREVNGYPYHFGLSQISPNHPVYLRHASGHSAFANAKAMELAGVTTETPDPRGGKIVRDVNGTPVGVFEETAMDVIEYALKEYQNSLSPDAVIAEWQEAVRLAGKECLENGITSFHHAGADLDELNRYQQLADQNKLDVRLYAMMRDSIHKMNARITEFPVLNTGNHFFTCRAIKSYIDGALGSYGAWLLEPYDDNPGFYGQNTRPVSEIEEISDLAIANGLQHCVHAIGDRANREVLNIYEKSFAANPSVEDPRWRIEHAQHINSEDILRFGPMGVIASMQGIHCTSDAPFVEKRLGLERARDEAYPWRSLLDSGVTIANGTDAPVEDVSPIECYYALVTRKRLDGMEFFTEQKMTRIEALRAYTLDNAYAAFEEDLKGSLEVGKLADLTILSKDILNCTDKEILEIRVLYTVVGGKIKYQAPK